MPAAVSIEHLTKTYRLGAISAGTVTGDLLRWWARVRGRPDPLLQIGHPHHARRVGEQFWALDDVSFDVQPGEVLGLIGRNGAGKSTLLKILSQVTAPTAGRISLRGRVASLLEVGTGFHPDLTGRENVFLNGAIMGMMKGEIRRKFDEIVAFSECESFIDTPVKRYSSGMYVRLAFAVAAHLEPEILIVDEVLAVGDAQFQAKCLGKMGEVSRGGRTVLLVSHNLGAVSRLCQRAVLLDGGRVAMVGTAAAAVASYLRSDGSSSAIWKRPPGLPLRTDVALTEVHVADESGAVANSISSTATITVVIEAYARTRTRPLQISFRITNQEGIAVFTSANTDQELTLTALAPGRHRFRCDIPPQFLAAGTYNLMVAVHVPRETLFDLVDSLNFTVENLSPGLRDDRVGVVTPRLAWHHALLETVDAQRSETVAPT